MSQGDRRCRSCRFFQAAPLAGKGWCRNPVLYAPSQQHLVDGRELDCQRAFGDFWQAPLDLPDAAEDTLAPPALLTIAPDVPVAPVMAAEPRDEPGAPGGRSGLSRPALVVALVALLAALVGMITFTSATNRPTLTALGPINTPAVVSPSPESGAGPAVAPSEVVVAVNQASPPPTREATPVATLAPVIAEPTPAPTAMPVQEPVAATQVAPTVVPAAPVVAVQPTVRTAPVGKLRVGGQAIVVTGASEQRLRMRSAPDLQAGIIGRLPNGSKIAVIDGPRQADGATWWRVRTGATTGWVSGDFVQPATP